MQHEGKPKAHYVIVLTWVAGFALDLLCRY